MTTHRLGFLFTTILACTLLATLAACESKSTSEASASSSAEGGAPDEPGASPTEADEPGAPAAADAPAAGNALGQWVDLDDGVRVAILGSKLAATPGGIMLDDDQRAAAILVEMVNTSDQVVPLYRQVVRVEAGGEQFGVGMDSSAALAAFRDEELTVFPNLQKLLPGQHLVGWQGVAVPDAATGDMTVLLGTGNPVADLEGDAVAARIPVDGASTVDPLPAPGQVEPTHQPGQSLEGGATKITVRSIEQLPEPRGVEAGQVVYVADLELQNTTDVERNINSIAGVALSFYLIDDAGHAFSAVPAAGVMDLPPADPRDSNAMMARARLGTWLQDLAAGATAEGKIAFTVPETARGLLLVTDSALGYGLVKEHKAARQAPLGVWPVGGGGADSP